MIEALIFWILAAASVLGAASVVICRNPVSSALSLAVTFGMLAAVFVTLGAFFLAAVQVIVYAGAVMVLFLFIIMLLDVKTESKRPLPWFIIFLAVGVSALLLTYFAESILSLNPASLPDATTMQHQPSKGYFMNEELNPPLHQSAPSCTLGPSPDSTDIHREPSLWAIGHLLFGRYLLATITTAVLLLVATIGVVLLSKSGVVNEPKETSS